MSRFKRCAKVAHAQLRAAFPTITLGHTQEILSRALGHNTYASFRGSDAQAFDNKAFFAVLDLDGAGLRALELGYEMSKDHWSLLLDEIKERAVIGNLELVEDVAQIAWAARYNLVGSTDSRIAAVCEHFPFGESHRIIEIRRPDLTASAIESGVPDHKWALEPFQRATVTGDIFGFADDGGDRCIGYPVAAEYAFERVGRRLYDEPLMLSVRLAGRVFPYAHHEDSMDGMFVGP